MDLTVSNIIFQGKLSNVSKRTILSIGSAATASQFIYKNNEENDPLMTQLEADGASKKTIIKKRLPAELKQKCINDIKAALQAAIDNKETLTITNLSKQTGIPESRIVAIIYNPKNVEIKNMFDLTKDSSRKKKQPNDDVIRTATNLIKSISGHKAIENSMFTEADYIKIVAQNLHKLSWPDETMKEFTKKFPENPALGYLLISVRNNKGESRKYINSPYTIDEIFEAHKINAELTKNLIEEQDENGNFKYSIYDIHKIVKMNDFSDELLEPAKINPSLAYNLFRETNTASSRRFSPEEIKELFNWSQKMPKFTKSLIDSYNGYRMKYVRGYRFTGKQIAYILDQYTKNPERVLSLVNEYNFKSHRDYMYRYNGDTIEEILKAYESGNKQKIRLAESLMKDDSKVDYRYNIPEIVVKLKELDNGDKITPHKIKEQKSLMKILEPIVNAKKADGTKRYSAEDVTTLMNFNNYCNAKSNSNGTNKNLHLKLLLQNSYLIVNKNKDVTKEIKKVSFTDKQIIEIASKYKDGFLAVTGPNAKSIIKLTNTTDLYNAIKSRQK